MSEPLVRTEDRKPPFSPMRLIPVAILVAGLVAFFVFGLDEFASLSALKENRQMLADWVDRAGILALAGYVLAYTLMTAFSVPGGAVLTIAGGFLFGTWLGGSLTILGATLGAAVLFLAARYAFADLLRARAGSAVRRMEEGFRENAFSYMLFLRLIPIFPFWLVNLVPAFLGVKLGTFVLGTAIGIIPGTFVFASLGNGFSAIVAQGGDIDLGIVFEPRFLLPIAGLAALALVPVVYRKIKVRRAPHG